MTSSPPLTPVRSVPASGAGMTMAARPPDPRRLMHQRPYPEGPVRLQYQCCFIVREADRIVLGVADAGPTSGRIPAAPVRDASGIPHGLRGPCARTASPPPQNRRGAPVRRSASHRAPPRAGTGRVTAEGCAEDSRRASSGGTATVHYFHHPTIPLGGRAPTAPPIRCSSAGPESEDLPSVGPRRLAEAQRGSAARPGTTG